MTSRIVLKHWSRTQATRALSVAESEYYAIATETAEGLRKQSLSFGEGGPLQRRPEQDGKRSVLFAAVKTISEFSLGSQVADCALFDRRPNTSLLASPAGWPFVLSKQEVSVHGCRPITLTTNAPVSTAAFIARRCSSPGGALVASLNLHDDTHSTADCVPWRLTLACCRRGFGAAAVASSPTCRRVKDTQHSAPSAGLPLRPQQALGAAIASPPPSEMDVVLAAGEEQRTWVGILSQKLGFFFQHF